MNILGIDNILIDVADLDAARHFYGTVLGLTEKYAFPDNGILGYRIGEEEPGLVIRLTETAATSAVNCRSPRIWLEVPDARQCATLLSNAGLDVLGAPTRIRTGWVVELTDPSGNTIGLTDYLLAPKLARPSTD